MKTRILVIDDKQSNLDNAKNQFKSKDVELTLCPLYSVGIEFIKTRPFDIVLTDLMLPGESEGISDNNPEIGKEVPYGLVVAILAKNYGVKNVAIMTDISHHSGPIAWAMDQLIGHGKDRVINAFPNKEYLNVAKSFMEIGEAEVQSEEEATQKTLMIAGVNDNYKRMLGEKLSDTFKIITVEEADKQRVATTFVEENPDLVLLVGEINGRVEKDSKFSIREEFEKIKQAKKPTQKVVVVGWMDSDNPNYLRLSIDVEPLLKLLKG